jgi:nanoRNase/pAp phosphatase (c-di-AMP/oligoRNAs hydrolase)
MESKFQELEEKIKRYEGKKILIALRGHPDPDSMSSASAHQFLLKQYNVNSVVAYSKEISDRENRALSKLAGLDFMYFNGSNINFSEFAGYSLVDSQLPDGDFQPHLNGHTVFSIVDHHDLHGELEPEFLHVDKEAGAAATIYAEYLKQSGFLEKPELEGKSRLIATILMHGIQNDTDSLTNAGTKDYQAIGFLSDYADLEILKKMSVRSLSARTMDYIVTAYSNRNGQENYALSGIGIIASSERDAIARAADFLLMREGIDTALVYGIVDNTIDCSFRTCDDAIRPSEFIKAAFPDVSEGKYGGKYDKGGFQLPLGIFSSIVKRKSANFLVQLVDEYMKLKLEDKLGVKEFQDNTDSKT